MRTTRLIPVSALKINPKAARNADRVSKSDWILMQSIVDKGGLLEPLEIDHETNVCLHGNRRLAMCQWLQYIVRTLTKDESFEITVPCLN